MMLYLLFFVIFAACVGFLYTEGMWSNAIRLINVVTAALLAMNFFEPVAGWLYNLNDMFKTFTYFWDFIALWGLFGALAVVLSLLTGLASRVKVKFLKLADRIGSGFFAAWIGWVMVCFTATTLHTAPLAREFMGGAFVPEQRALGGALPAGDVLWLGFTQRMSLGPFARTDTEPGKKEDGVFDRQGDFMLRYAARRQKLESHAMETGALRVRPEQTAAHN